MTQRPPVSSSVPITDGQMKEIEYLPFIRPGITTGEIARRLGLVDVDVESAARNAGIASSYLAEQTPTPCHIDSSQRWWRATQVTDLDEWCLVQPDPHCADPDPSLWRKIAGIDRDEMVVVFSDSFAWSPLPPARRVLFSPHPLAISGPW